MRRLRAVRRQVEARKGATLVLVAMLMVVLTGFVGVGVDFARAYAFKTQLKTVTDAAALAGAIEMIEAFSAGTAANEAPQTAALGYVPINTLEGIQTAYSADSNVDAVAWDFDNRTIDVTKGSNGSLDDNYDSPDANAIRVVARYTMNTTFGRVFGVTDWTLVDTTIAALGGVGPQDCLKPWAVSYQSLLQALFPNGLPPEGVNYNLTPEDMAALSSNQSPFTLLQGSGNPTTPGNIAQVVTYEPGWADQVTDANGSPYAKAIKTSTCPNKVIGPGTWLDTDPGAGSGQTGGPLKDFCAANGGVTAQGQNFTCNDAPKVKLAMWDINNGASGAGLKYRVKYVGVFAVTGFQKATGQPGTNPDQIFGYFSTMPTDGGFVGAPGPTYKGAIVY
jgi:hypothetical protein